MGAYTIRVPDFEGPLDLLLFFIRRDELDIYDIPIAHITREFLSYVHVMQMLDLELAGEFIVMAATLMQIKARMLLPREVQEDGEDEGEDPRMELTRRLLEYKRYKEAAEELQEYELDQRMRFYRQFFKSDVKSASPDDDDPTLRDVTLFHLIAAFQHAMEHIPAPVTHEIRTIPYTIEEQGLFLMQRFAGRRVFSFLEIIGEMKEKIQLVVTFIALLELIRAHRVRIETAGDFNDIRIYRETSE